MPDFTETRTGTVRGFRRTKPIRGQNHARLGGIEVQPDGVYGVLTLDPAPGTDFAIGDRVRLVYGRLGWTMERM